MNKKVISNDYGRVTWTEKHEKAALLIEEVADTLQMTAAELMDDLRDRWYSDYWKKR